VVCAAQVARGALLAELLREPACSDERRPTREQVLAELDWTLTCAVEHLGEQRATRYLRKFYPWYVPRLQLDVGAAKELQESLQSAPTLAEVRALLADACRPAALAL
jgi:tRNA-dihydrouridine synthase